MKLSITCECGHRVIPQEIIDTGLYITDSKPVCVYVRYVCSRCGGQRERVVQFPLDQELQHRTGGGGVVRRRRTPAGPISGAELREFHSMLVEQDDDIVLSYLRATTHFPRRRRRRRRPAE